MLPLKCISCLELHIKRGCSFNIYTALVLLFPIVGRSLHCFHSRFPPYFSKYVITVLSIGLVLVVTNRVVHV